MATCLWSDRDNDYDYIHSNTMSTCRQAIAARRKACIDIRYKARKFGDATVSKHRLEAKVRRELDRQRRKRRSKELWQG